ncbi:MAG: carboxypeptidase-like regulatory domain-containing protein [Kofleriaceae bacterium]
MTGTVVDREGKPVAGAQVVTATILNTDTIGILLPYIGDDDEDDNYLRATTTNAAGEFSFTDAPEVGVIEAQMGAYRSVAERTMNGQKLVLKPTRRLAGKVDIGKVDPTDVIISLHDPADHTSRALIFTPIKPDGTFALDGVPQTKASLSVNVQTPAGLRFATPIEIPAGTEPISNLALGVPAASARKVWVLGRSTLSVPLEGAQVVLVPGRISVLTIGQLQALDQKSMMVRFARHVTGESVPQEAAAVYKTGDLLAEFSDVPEGTFSACLIPLPADIGNDKALNEKIMKHREDIDVRCDVLGPDDNAIAITAPPMKNFD